MQPSRKSGISLAKCRATRRYCFPRQKWMDGLLRDEHIELKSGRTARSPQCHWRRAEDDYSSKTCEAQIKNWFASFPQFELVLRLRCWLLSWKMTAVACYCSERIISSGTVSFDAGTSLCHRSISIRMKVTYRWRDGTSYGIYAVYEGRWVRSCLVSGLSFGSRYCHWWV